MKYILKMLLLTLACALLFCGCADKGMINLNETDANGKKAAVVYMNLPADDFKEQAQEGFYAVYASDNIAVFVTRETYADVEKANIGLTKASSNEDYAKVVIANNALGTLTPTTDENGITTFVYDKLVDGVSYTYIARVEKSDDSFWLFQFSMETDDFTADKNQTMLGYAKGVKVVKPYVAQ